jgi:SAM-dependent methyltransferase
MYSGFPLNQLVLLRCLHDAGELEVEETTESGGEGRVLEGVLACVACGARYGVEAGIVRMLEEDALDPESRHERRKRDEEAARYHTFVADEITSEMEMQPTIAALRARRDAACFELGCGTGRYTVRLARMCGAVLAVDFSGESLAILARGLDADAPVGLVQADVARLRLAPRSFHCGLSTLVSNLPTAAIRTAMYRLAAEALQPDGRFVFGTHFYGLLQRLRRVPRAGAYTVGGIYRRCFDRREIRAEVRPYFRHVAARPVQIPVPLARRLGLSVVGLSRLLGYVPGVSELGNLLLVEAALPIAASPDAAPLARAGSRALAGAPTAEAR